MKIGQGVFHNGYFSSPPVGARRGSFLALHSKNVVESLEVKPTKVYGLSKVTFPRVSHSQDSAHSALNKTSKLPCKCSYKFMAPVASAPGRQILAMSLNLPVFSDFRR